MKNMVAEKVRLERLKQNLSQQNMADELGITAAAYSNLERGVSDISITRLFDLARILNQTPQWFVEELNSSKDLSIVTPFNISLSPIILTPYSIYSSALVI